MKKALDYAARNHSRFESELFELLRIPSVSPGNAHGSDMAACASWLRDKLLAAGADKAEVMATTGNPVVWGEKITDPARPTVLVYGHYDVMPAEPLDEWRTDPFEPVIKEGRIWARGANDDKGQLFMHLKAFEAMAATGEVPCNVRFMLEGEEEIGSPALTAWCAENKELLKADIILVSDTSMLSMDIPSITCGLRGLCYMQVEVDAPSHDLHSGHFGGAVANPCNVLAKMIGELVDERGRITIPGFYDGVRELTTEERAAFNSAPFDEAKFVAVSGVPCATGEEGYTVPERTGVRPSLDVNGIWGGYTAEGTKTIIPARAHAKISMRLVPGQDPAHIAELFEKHFVSIAPKSVRVKAKYLHGGMPYVCPPDIPAYKAAEKALTATFGHAPVPFYTGGSIPVISTFEKVLGTKTILMGFGLESDAIHSPNESFALDCFYRGIDSIIRFHHEFSKQ